MLSLLLLPPSLSSPLRRPQLSIATAIVFYHRFYARESYETYERFQAGASSARVACCAWLALRVAGLLRVARAR